MSLRVVDESMIRLIDWLVKKFVDAMSWLLNDNLPARRQPHYGVPPKEEI